jgi:hypothetical protein
MFGVCGRSQAITVDLNVIPGGKKLPTGPTAQPQHTPFPATSTGYSAMDYSTYCGRYSYR